MPTSFYESDLCDNLHINPYYDIWLLELPLILDPSAVNFFLALLLPFFTNFLQTVSAPSAIYESSVWGRKNHSKITKFLLVSDKPTSCIDLPDINSRRPRQASGFA